MISLAGRDILHAWGKFVFTGIGLGLLIGVTLVMAGVYRGMVDDGKALLDNSGADLWVVQKDTLGPYAESSSLNDDVYRAILAMPGVAQAANVTYLTMQVRKGESDVRTMVVGIAPGALGATPGWPPYLVAGRQITRGHYEAVADIATGFKLGDRLAIRRNHYTVVGLTRRMVSSSGDPMVFIPLKGRHLAKPASHRSQPGFQSTRCSRFAGCRDCFTEHQRVRQCSTGHTETWPYAGRGCRIHPALEAFDGLHPGTDGRHPRRQVDRHLGQADRHVLSDSGHR